MQRRGKSGHSAKARRTTMRKVRKAPVALVTTAKLRKQLDDRTLERDEALEQLAATSEVLKVISGSHGELEPVFQSIYARRPFRSGICLPRGAEPCSCPASESSRSAKTRSSSLKSSPTRRDRDRECPSVRRSAGAHTWQNRWTICAPRRTGLSRRKNLPRSASSPPVSRMKSRTRSTS